MIRELNNELIFGYETFCERQVDKHYETVYLQMMLLTHQQNVIYFYIKKDGIVAYKCWGGEHKECRVSSYCLSNIRKIIAADKEKIMRFVIGASWQGWPISFVFENSGYGIRATDTSELSRVHDKFNINPVFNKIFNVLYSEIPELARIEKYTI